MTDREKAAAAARIGKLRVRAERLEEQVREVRGRMRAEARTMREGGCTLDEVAAALGVTRQRAHALVGDVDRG